MATNNALNIPTGTINKVVMAQGVGVAHALSTATYPATTTANEILYSSATNTVSEITAVNNGTLITSAAGVPSLLANGTTGQVLTATTSSPPSWKAAGGGGGGEGFLAYKSATANNVTGDGTVYTVVCNTEVYDDNSNYNSSTGTFTAPSTGKYIFCYTITINDYDGAGLSQGKLVTSNRTYTIEEERMDTGHIVSYGFRQFSSHVDMDTSDTAYITISENHVSGKITDVIGGTANGLQTIFSCSSIG